MGITVIKHIINDSGQTVNITNTENPQRLKNGGTVGPSKTLSVDMNIPWATTETEFESHHISVIWERGKVSRIHQHADVDGDFVRVSSRLGGDFPGSPMSGDSHVDGVRVMRLKPKNRISLLEI